MRYISTRGKAQALNFEDVLLTGLASDGGLYVPAQLPQFSSDQIGKFAELSYPELALQIIKPFVGDCFTENELQEIITQTYAEFKHAAIAPLKQLGADAWLLELFHGPTLAFKDFALQLLGRMLDKVLIRRGKHGLILGATSGDTGSAAIEGCRNCQNVSIVILHPHNLVSEVQRRQMTTAISPNIHNIAVKGNFDDCQELVKRSFAQQDFVGDKSLIAVNSINWARIMAQIVYYFYAATRIGSPHKNISFVVPTGNFGDIYAGFLAHKMGLPVSKLVVATNHNDILHRFMQHNDYSKSAFKPSLAPSMDIMVSSNFERLLFDYHQNNADEINELLSSFQQTGKLSVNNDIWHKIRQLFDSYMVNDAAICQTISDVYQQTEEVIDPHTAIGVCAAQNVLTGTAESKVILATAHPAKFADAIIKVQVPAAKLPTYLADLLSRDESYQVLTNNLTELHFYIKQNC